MPRTAPAVPGLRVVHALSPAVPEERDVPRAANTPPAVGWHLTEVDAGEFADPDYRANPVNRCYFCKSNLYARIAHVTEGPIASGANLDDLGDYRPGLIAAAEHRVRHPFVEAGMAKAAVRALARGFELADIAELPAQPCLPAASKPASRSAPRTSRSSRAWSSALSPHVAGGRICAAVSPTRGSSSRPPEPDAAMRQIAGELCQSADRRFLGFRAYRRGAAFLHDRP